MISFVTVVFRNELPLLRLQARSMAQFLNPGFVGQILVVINDKDENDVAEAVRAVLSDYGWLRDKTRIIGSNEIFRWEALRNSLFGDWTKLRTLYPSLTLRRPQAGWRGNRGWQIQQAFKLAVARAVETSYCVILDPKNVFLRPVTLADYVDGDGRARAQFIKIGDLNRKWLHRSFQTLESKQDVYEISETTQFTTPFVISTSLLKEVLSTVEEKAGPVQSVFALKKPPPTEFMLISAFCFMYRGGVRRVFANGLQPSASFFRSFTKEQINVVLEKAVSGEVNMIGLHRAVIARLSASQKQKLLDLLIKREVVNKHVDVEILLMN